MKMNKLQWASGRGDVYLNNVRLTDVANCDGIIDRVLRSNGVAIATDWDAPCTASATVSDDDVAAIRAAVVVRNAARVAIVTCKKCGCTNLRGAHFTTLAGQQICDDCV